LGLILERSDLRVPRCRASIRTNGSPKRSSRNGHRWN